MAGLEDNLQLQEMVSATSISQNNISYETSAVSSPLHLKPIALSWSTQAALILVLSIIFLSKISSPFIPRSSPPSPSKTIPILPYHLPVIGHLLQLLRAPHILTHSIISRFGRTSIVRLNILTKDIYVVSGASHIISVFKNNTALSSNDSLNIALRSMFNTPTRDMTFFHSDRTGISHTPHPQAATRRPEDRVFHLIFKVSADCLTGSQLQILGQRFQCALSKQLDVAPLVEKEKGTWTEIDDLFGFLRPMIAAATLEAICGARFLEEYPDFIPSFYEFNAQVPRLLKGWPGILLPKACRARERCIAIMQAWRRNCDGRPEGYDGSALMLRRWECYSRMEGLSEYGVACSDLGILWGMLSNGVTSTFWLLFHTLQSPDLLSAATKEVEACRISPPITQPNSPSAQVTSADLNTATLTSQPLLQSLYAETLRKYISIYLTRRTEFAPVRILDYFIPRNRTVVMNSAIAHMDPANFNEGAEKRYPVTSFWGERFLTCTPSSRTRDSQDAAADKDIAKPGFSLDRYKGAWMPFGGGAHQCPGRHWVKVQMVVSLALIARAWDIELVGKREEIVVDLGRYGLGALEPGESVRARIRRKVR